MSATDITSTNSGTDAALDRRDGSEASALPTASPALASSSSVYRIAVLFRRELAGFFYSPMSYLAWALFLIASGYLFVTSLRDGGSASLSGTFVSMAVLLVFVVPLLTMRLLAEELRLGILEVLMTDPVSEFEIVLAKYLATLVFIGCVLTPTLVYPSALAYFGQPDPGPVLAGYIGLLMLGSLFAAVGLCASALTENQIAAAALAFTVLLIFWALDRAAGAMEPGRTRDVLEYLSAFARFSSFRRGVVDTRSLFYCLSLSSLALFIAANAVGLRRLR